MKQCKRCMRWHRSPDSEVCERCWEALGQMSMELDEEDNYDPPIDTVFDQMEEREGRQ